MLYGASGAQLDRSSLQFVMSSNLGNFPASNCNDGNLNSFCHLDDFKRDPVSTINITYPCLTGTSQSLSKVEVRSAPVLRRRPVRARAARPSDAAAA